MDLRNILLKVISVTMIVSVFSVPAFASKGEGKTAAVLPPAAEFPVTIDPWVQEQELIDSDGAPGDYFGYSVALSNDGNTALVGACAKTVGSNTNQGAAYVFTRSGTTWTMQQELTPSDGAARDTFGWSVSLSGDGNTASVGASHKTVGSNTNQGAVYVFTRSGTTWTQQQELTAADGAANDSFGFSVSLSGDGNTALVGAYWKTIASNAGQGAAYIFTRSGTTWNEQQKLTSTDGAAGDSFGNSVSLSGDGNTALVGAKLRTYGANEHQGAAYVFTRSGTNWTQQQELTASAVAALDYFGNSVSLGNDGNTALVGSIGKEAAYVYTRSGTTWTQQQQLSAADGTYGDNFSESVSLSSDGNAALVGARYKTVGSNIVQGAAYLFTKTDATWEQQQKFVASDGIEDDQFGISVSLNSDGSRALIGAFYKAVSPASRQGAAFVFRYPYTPPTIAKSFGAASIPLGGTTSLSFTICNPNSVALTAIGFTDNLPAGIVISTPNGLSGDCGGGTITAVEGYGQITLTGATLSGGGSCTFSVNVSGVAAGSQNNVTGNIGAFETVNGGTASASINVVNPLLSIAFAGSGSGTVISNSPDAAINCIRGSTTGCSANYPPGTSVTLFATGDWRSLFGGWSNGISSSANPVTFTMNSDKSVTAIFNLAPLLQLGPTGYLTLQAAYDAATSGSIIQMLDSASFGTLDAWRDIAVTLKGGYDTGYTSNTGFTQVNSPLILEQGRLSIDRIFIK